MLVTAGPTRERVDPVRFISNYSTGVFGYEIARQARRAGFKVTLVSGPTALEDPEGVKVVRVVSALEMRRAVLKEFGPCDAVVMAAAVGDWRVRSLSKNKIKRGGSVTLELAENPDILAELGRKKGKRVLVGFALESGSLEGNARRKLLRKNLDMIVANRVSPGRDVFGEVRTDVLVIDRSGGKKVFRGRTKREIAKFIIDKVRTYL